MSRKLRIPALAVVLSALSYTPISGNPAGYPSLSAFLGFSAKIRAAAAPDRPGIYFLAGSLSAFEGLSRIVLKPFAEKVNGRIGRYRLGVWPYEKRAPAHPRYANPKGFIEVMPENFATRVSEHFTLGEFVTKDQREVWPKYVVLDQRLLDKLELTIAELSSRGLPVSGLHVMSGFRSPRYNARGVGAGGRSAVSRHQYGDAADVYPDGDRDGRMDDLNRDGRVDLKDARILADAADAVEHKNPDLAGGIGLYPATSAHGPMVHIDARGKRARWPSDWGQR